MALFKSDPATAGPDWYLPDWELKFGPRGGVVREVC